MITLDYRMLTTSRVSAGSGPEVLNSRGIHTVIPGGTLRGALATAWARDHGFDWSSRQLRTLFERALVVRQAVWEHAELHGMSYVQCKYAPTAECAGRAHDVAQRLAENAEPIEECQCGGGWEHGRGWGRLPDGGTVATTRTALTKGVAAEQQLFTRRAVERGLTFTGELILDESIIDATEPVSWFTTARRLRVGGQRSVLGEIEFQAHPQDLVLPPLDRGPSGLVVLRCLSPLIATGSGGESSLDAEPALRRVLGSQLVIENEWVRPFRVSGWHMASGLPKPEEWALAAGSTFLVGGVPDDTALRLRPGVGLRTREGYGEVVIVPPRTEVSPSAAAATPDNDLSTEPADPLTGVIEELVAKLGRDTPTAVRGLLSAFTRARLTRQNGFPDSVVRQQITDLLGLPWARSLSGASASTLPAELAQPDPETLRLRRSLLERLAAERGL